MNDYNNRLADLRQLYEKLEAENTRLRRDLEANTNAFVSLQRDADATTRQVQTLSDDRAMLQGQLQMSRSHVKELKATLDRLTKDYLSLKVKLHLKTGTVSEDDFINCATEYSADKQTATEALEFQNYERAIDRLLMREAELIAELKRVRAYNKKLEFDLRHAERAYTRLKDIYHKRDLGTPPFYAPPKLPSPKWVVCFYRDGLELGTITYTHTPSTSALNMLQESLKASSWRLTYHHD